MMKISWFVVLLTGILCIGGNVYADQSFKTDSLDQGKSLIENIWGKTSRKDLLHVGLNTRMAFRTRLSGAEAEKSAFRMEYLRLEVKGDITERIFYKWLQHLNRSNRPGNLDGMPSSIDCLGVGFRITPRLTTFVGKQYADFGGFEYDADPAQVYAYSDLGENLTCFLVGINLAWQCTPTQELRIQVVDNHSDDTENTHGPLPEGMETARTPLGYTLNWNGNFCEERLFTRCSFSLFHETRQENVYFWALAAAWVTEKFNMYTDFMYSIEDIDKLGILSGIVSTGDQPLRARDSRYLSCVSRINYRLYPKLNFFLKGSWETASVQRSFADVEKGRYRTTWGYQGGIEYFPMKENLRFYLLYRGQHFRYSGRAIIRGRNNETPQFLSLGLIYNINIYNNN